MPKSEAGSRIAVATLAALLLWIAPPSARAQPQEGREPTRSWDVAATTSSPLSPGGWSAHASLGFTLDPDAFLLATGAEYALSENLGVGPLFQFGIDDDFFLFAPTANLRYRVSLADAEPEPLRNLALFVQGGVGLAYIDIDRRSRDDDDVGFLLNGGFGFEYAFTDRFSVGNSVLFNGMPANVLGENFFFSWQFLTARYRF